MATLKCHFIPTEYEAAEVPLDIRDDHVEIVKWVLAEPRPSWDQEKALEVAQVFSYIGELGPDAKGCCPKIARENQKWMRYIKSYRSDGMGAPLLRRSGGTEDQIKRDLDADSIICGAINHVTRRDAEAGT